MKQPEWIRKKVNPKKHLNSIKKVIASYIKSNANSNYILSYIKRAYSELENYSDKESEIKELKNYARIGFLLEK